MLARQALVVLANEVGQPAIAMPQAGRRRENVNRPRHPRAGRMEPTGRSRQKLQVEVGDPQYTG
jgi:hypothetical protein